jgi:hypothetical protein
MKRQLLSLHPLNQSPDPINSWLIYEPGRQETMVLDFLIDLVALVTHRPLPLRAQGPAVDRLQSESRPVPAGAANSSHVPFKKSGPGITPEARSIRRAVYIRPCCHVDLYCHDRG